jgi:hypothetical protein
MKSAIYNLQSAIISTDNHAGVKRQVSTVFSTSTGHLGSFLYEIDFFEPNV